MTDRLEPLELAEQRYDLAMADPESTWEERYEALVKLARRAYYNVEDAESLIETWVKEHPAPRSATSEHRDARGYWRH